MYGRSWKPTLLISMLLVALASCGAPTLLPEGPTAIPTLVPVTELPSAIEPTEEPSFAILSYPAQLPSAARGQQIYAENCAQCHGPDGTGTVPGSRNFQDLDYIRGETPANFYAAVTEGRGQMPAYRDRLSSDERWDVVFYVWRIPTSEADLALGREIYQSDCTTCHGEDGSGELLGSADFTDLRQMDGLAPRDLYLTVTQGRGSMPAWQSQLSQDERWAVIDYLRTFSYDPELNGEVAVAEPTERGEVSEPITCPTDRPNPFEPDDTVAIQAGREIYQGQCAACHGADASGGLPDTPDFTAAEVHDDLIADPGRYYCAVAEGMGAMPTFGSSLSETQIWQVLAYLRSTGP